LFQINRRLRPGWLGLPAEMPVLEPFPWNGWGGFPVVRP
jgi:hypothetical protein